MDSEINREDPTRQLNSIPLPRGAHDPASPFMTLAQILDERYEVLGEAGIFALVIGLVSRWTQSAPMLFLLAGVVLVGLLNPSDWLGRGWAFLAGVAALWVFSAFDLTTLIAAIFSWALWLNGTAALRALEDVGNGQVVFGLLGWGALLVWGVFAAYRPLWAGLQRNLRAKLD